jgi:GT2 family glycosyltransferase
VSFLSRGQAASEASSDAAPRRRRAALAVVVVNWNGGLYVLRCLDSAQKSDVAVDQLVVVDNGSADGSPEAIGRYHPEVDLVVNPENRGFAAACNQGIERALARGAEFVFLLNSDAELRADTLTHLLDAAERNPNAGMLAGKILTDGGKKIWCAGLEVGFFPNLQRMRGFFQRDVGQYDTETDVPALTGCGLLIRRSLVEKIGLFDPRFFVYCEDIDLAIRAEAAGLKCRYVPAAVMYHDYGMSTGGGYSPWRKYLLSYHLVVFVRKHPTPARWFAFIVFEVLLWPVLFLWSVVRGHGKAAIAKWRGTWSALLGRPMQRPRPNITPVPS